MDKNAVKSVYKKYAVWAREELKKKVTAKAIENEIIEDQQPDALLESINGEVLSETRKKQRKALIRRISEVGYDQVMEEVAYTWFNRFVAIRFMEVNGYLPSHVRVFSDESGKFNPQILAEAIHLDISGLDMDKVMALKEAEDNDELFKYLLVIQCNALNEILPQMFQKLEDYTELLLPDYLLREGSVIEKLVNDIPDEYFDVNADEGQIEIIGWMYQYYISEKHEEVIDPLHGKVVKKEEVPAATQLFTTDWVVQYIIDNSVGKYWIERNPESKLADELTYFVKPKDGVIKTIDEKITPQDVTVFDPCVGSGHFLVYAFEVLMKIYVEYGYSERDAAVEIVKNNLYGLDIDGRATQLAYFAIMMKARQYDRRFLTRGIQPNIREICESNNIDVQSIKYFCGGSADLSRDVETIINVFMDAKEYGSILQIPEVNFKKIDERFDQLSTEINMYNAYLFNEFKAITSVASMMSNKYAIVATNPPYLNKYDNNLKEYINSRYSDYKGDLFSIFIYKNIESCVSGGYAGLMTPMVWMFIKTYEKLRQRIVDHKQISTLIQFEYSAYEEATVPICAFVIKNDNQGDTGYYFKLSDFRGGMEVQKEKVLEALNNDVCGYFYSADQKNFKKIPGSTIAFWWTNYGIFDNEKISNIYESAGRNKTHGNDLYVRNWWEISDTNRWQPYANGGEFRRWAGNDYDLVDWSSEAKESYASHGGLYNQKYAGKQGICWNLITSYKNGFRIKKGNHHYSSAAPTIISNEPKHDYYVLAFLNSCVAEALLKMYNPTLNTTVGDVLGLPLRIEREDEIIQLAEKAYKLSQEDWNSFETSSEFTKHPFCKKKYSSIECAYNDWAKECEDRFNLLKQSEEELNTAFISIYNIEGSVNPIVDEKDVTVNKADLNRDVKSFISYAVGCMFGRYSLDREGLLCTGTHWEEENYKSFPIDKDNIIPVCDDEYFGDDVVSLFVKFVEVVFGKDSLEDNLSFIANALGGNGMARDVIREYFLNGFYADHTKTYQKRPIYWQFSSGKKNGFTCLVYLHRYQADTVARIRTDYIHELQSRYATALDDLEKRINEAGSNEKIKLERRKNNIRAQEEELHKYEESVHHIADQMVSLDLNEGIKVNYAKLQKILSKIK
ncbi:BREX-1 system adenine-specific DNA-methyltransferase PglX [Butyrivibrio sp. AE2015]|uniref:BREX-1 system adenine-specific DNA-methyltransferase PglX n=1 Tax=Butyrivibrio sp. AE2015 TaxID=1280663 RepID=UPI0003B3FEF6|nr:BREX-1 system adenine-specific DNA-methyltransferase PglX [Butyrivibrio sp. AE2015]